jgi:nicotinamidase-related amidase
MDWKTAYRSFYYANAEEPEDIRLDPQTTALLVIDVQNTYLEDKDTPEETARWQPFYDRMRNTVIPNTARLIEECRQRGVEVIFARIACLKRDGRDRSLVQKQPGFNNLLLPKDRPDSQVVPELAPQGDDIVMLKTTDSALTGTNLRLLLRNMGIETVVCAGIFTDQCVSSTVRSLCDESFAVLVVDDCCAAATMELHRHELEIINMIYCHVVQLDELLQFFVIGMAKFAEDQSRNESVPLSRSNHKSGTTAVAKSLKS